MKKIFFIFVVAIIVVLSSCSKNNKLFDINYEAAVSDKLLFVTENEVYKQDDMEIAYTITNICDAEWCIAGDPNCFRLEKLVNGEWKRVGRKNDEGWNYSAQILQPGETEMRKIILEEYFYLPLEKGEYRISIEDIVSNTFEIY